MIQEADLFPWYEIRQLSIMILHLERAGVEADLNAPYVISLGTMR